CEGWHHINKRHASCGLYAHEEEGDQKARERDKQQDDEKKSNPETVAESEALETRYDRALTEIFDHIDLKAIYLDDRVEAEMEKLKQSLSRTDAEEDWEDHFDRISLDTMRTIDEVRKISRAELKLDA